MNQKKDYVLRWIPKYSIIPLITALVLNTLVYSGTMVLCKGLYHHDFTTAFDRMVPVIPEFTSIYLICYVFWVVNYIMTARISREHMYRFLTADYLSRIVCGIFFVFLPTTLVRPEITGSGITIFVFDRSIGKLISIDSLSGKLVLLYWDQASEEDSSVVSEIFTCFCNFSLYFHAGNQAALYHRCVWRDHFK